MSEEVLKVTYSKRVKRRRTDANVCPQPYQICAFLTLCITYVLARFPYPAPSIGLPP